MKSIIYTICSTLIGIVLMIISCVFLVLALVNIKDIAMNEYITMKSLTHIFWYIGLGCLFMLLSMTVFLSEIFKSLSKIEKHIANE